MTIRNHHGTRRVAIVLSNLGVSTTTGWPVGFWWSELTHPYLAFMEAGYDIDLYSPAGGKVQGDSLSDPRDPSGYSATDLISMGFVHSPNLLSKLDETAPVAALQIGNYDALLVAGGQGPMFTFKEADALALKFTEFFDSGRVTATVCHGAAVLCHARDAQGNVLVKGRTVTGFCNAEEDFSDNAVWDMGVLPRDKHLMPWRIEDTLRDLGANFVHAGAWQPFAVRDENLITGQQNFSGGATARLMVEALGR